MGLKVSNSVCLASSSSVKIKTKIKAYCPCPASSPVSHTIMSPLKSATTKMGLLFPRTLILPWCSPSPSLPSAQLPVMAPTLACFWHSIISCTEWWLSQCIRVAIQQNKKAYKYMFFIVCISYFTKSINYPLISYFKQKVRFALPTRPLWKTWDSWEYHPK